ncbi:hypothetical protein [Tateyamaria sp.]|uniref:hypothetical protein n=1 Tax=Tateyamaria sp. TaxID=1929288 RepID=UPI003B20DCDF
MSDPMTNTEVEDVLSSIRRLVSDEKRTEPESATAPASDRLVLTPSLRVLDDDVSAEAEYEAEPELAQDDVSEDEVSAPGQVTYAHEARDHAEAEQDQAQDDEDSAPILLQAHDAVIEESVSLDDHDASPNVPAPETLGEKIAALETLIAGRSDEFEPDEAGADAYAGTEAPAMAWEDAEEEDEEVVEATFVSHVEATATSEPEDDTPFFTGDDDILDEDALRELVSDIVRQELQGALGERITRNVRKLVRREIHRALAAQDLE